MNPASPIPVLAASVLAPSAGPPTERASVDELVTRIKDPDAQVRGAAWQGAAAFGAPAIPALARMMTDPGFEVARAAQRALWKIVRYAGRPGAESERQAVCRELIALLSGAATVVRREALWMLSEIGGDEVVPAIAACLAERDTREDARAALERIPGGRAISALQAGLIDVGEDFKPAIAQSLRVRGVSVAGYPSQKLVPTRPVSGGAKAI